MKMEFKKGQKIKVDGPASILVKEGIVWSLGRKISERERITIPIAKTVLLEIISDTVAEVSLGENAKIEKIEDPVIPYEWRTAIESIYNDFKPSKILILGGANTGKSLFTIHLANYYTSHKEKIGIIDEDLGQSEIGPPTVISSTLLTKPIINFFQTKLYDGYFIGTVDPRDVTENILVGVKILSEKLAKEDLKAVIINTDGWIQGEKARCFKINMINLLKPDIIVAIQRYNELEHIIKAFERQRWIQIIRLIAPNILKPRSPELRKLVRESMYTKYLNNLKILKIDVNKIPLMFSSYGSSFPLSSKMIEKVRRNIGEEIFSKIEYIGMNSDEIVIVVNDINIIEVLRKNFSETFRDKRVRIIRKGDEKGLIVGIYDYYNAFLGIGYIDEIYYKRGIIKIKANIPSIDDVGLIYLGQVKLDERCNEIKRIKMWDL